MFGRHTIEYIDIDKERREREDKAKTEIVKEEMQTKSFIEILELSKSSDNEILQKYKFTLWCDLSTPIRYYILNRFKINLFTRGECTPIGHNATSNEPVGKVLEDVIKSKPQKVENKAVPVSICEHIRIKGLLAIRTKALEKIRNCLLGESFSESITAQTKKAEILEIIGEVRDGE